MFCVLIYSVLVLLYFDSIVIDYYYLYHIVIDYSFAQNCVKLISYCYYYPTVMFFLLIAFTSKINTLFIL